MVFPIWDVSAMRHTAHLRAYTERTSFEVSADLLLYLDDVSHHLV